MILGQKWLLKYKNNLKDDDGNECHGLCDYEEKILWVDKKTVLDGPFWETTVHETLHAALDEACIELDPKLEEALVGILSRVIVSNFKIKFR